MIAFFLSTSLSKYILSHLRTCVDFFRGSPWSAKSVCLDFSFIWNIIFFLSGLDSSVERTWFTRLDPLSYDSLKLFDYDQQLYEKKYWKAVEYFIYLSVCLWQRIYFCTLTNTDHHIPLFYFSAQSTLSITGSHLNWSHSWQLIDELVCAQFGI